MPLTILTYNVHAFAGPGFVEAFPRQVFFPTARYAERFLAVVDEVDPDILGVNEFTPHGIIAPYRDERGADMLRHVAGVLTQRDRERGRDVVWRSMFAPLVTQNGHFGNALFVRLPADAGPLLTGETTTFQSLGAKRGVEKAVMSSVRRNYIITPVPLADGTTLLVVLTHLEDAQSRPKIEVRRRQMQELVAALDHWRARYPGAPVVLLGDLNAPSRAVYARSPLKGLLARWFSHDNPFTNESRTNTHDVLWEAGYVDTVTANRVKGAPVAPTFPAWRLGTTLDYIYTTPEVAVRTAQALTHGLARRTSDHLPVMATLDIASPVENIPHPPTPSP